MNEPLFKNSFIRDKSTANAIVKAMLLQMRLMKFVYVAFVISLALSIAILVFQKRMPSSFDLLTGVSTYVFIPFMFLVMCVALRTQNIPKGGQSEEEFVFTDKEMVWTSAGKTHTYAIKDIFMYYDAKDYILVIPKGRTPMVPTIKKDSFTLGTSNEFIAFLKSKGVKIQK